MSRHLKILCEAGLVSRLRQGQWVHYRVTDAEPAVGFVQGLLAQLSKTDPVVTRDRSRLLAATSTAPTRQVAASESRLGRALRAFMEAAGQQSAHSALVVGTDHLELLEAAARGVQACTAIAHSRRSAQAARAYAEREDFSCNVILATNGDTLTDRDTEGRRRAVRRDRAGSLHHRRDFARDHARHRQARTGQGGQLWLFEKYDALEGSRDRVVEHPIARVRRMLNEAGLTCDRLSPIEADGEHMLAAVATLSTQTTSTTGVQRA